jgi:hypothetical protein
LASGESVLIGSSELTRFAVVRWYRCVKGVSENETAQRDANNPSSEPSIKHLGVAQLERTEYARHE